MELEQKGEFHKITISYTIFSISRQKKIVLKNLALSLFRQTRFPKTQFNECMFVQSLVTYSHKTLNIE